MNVTKLTRDLLELLKKYGHTPRTSVTHDRYLNVVSKNKFPPKNIELTDLALREPLLEHVGCLPVIASYLHPHIEHSKEVNLGRSLIMLAIHDIGETVVGDVASHLKKQKEREKELAIALKLVHPNYKKLLMEYEERKSMDAKFAKSVDSMSPILVDLMLEPKVMMKRFKLYGLTCEIAEKGKRDHFKWDKVLIKIFEYLNSQQKKREKAILW